MKKTMRISGLISMSLMTIGAIFKIMHWPGAGLLLLFGFTLMGFVFLPSALYVMRKEVPMKFGAFIYTVALIGGIPFLLGILFKVQHWPIAGILLLFGYLVICLLLIPALLISKLKDGNSKKLHKVYILGAVSISIYLLGDLFKIQHYPGAAPLLLYGAVMLTTVFLPIYGYKVFRDTAYVKGSFIYLCIGVFFFNMFNILLALNVSKDVLYYNVRPGKEILSTTRLIDQKNKSIIVQLANDSTSSDTVILDKVRKIEKMSDELVGFVKKIKIDLFVMGDGISEKDALAEESNPELIQNKSLIVPADFLCGTSPAYNDGKATELKLKLDALKKDLQTLCSNDDKASVIISNLLDTSNKKDSNAQNSSWELQNFYNLPLIVITNKLGLFQRNICIAENEALMSVYFNEQ